MTFSMFDQHAFDAVDKLLDRIVELEQKQDRVLKLCDAARAVMGGGCSCSTDEHYEANTSCFKATGWSLDPDAVREIYAGKGEE